VPPITSLPLDRVNADDGGTTSVLLKAVHS
jgi:hypothetical protein